MDKKYFVIESSYMATSDLVFSGHAHAMDDERPVLIGGNMVSWILALLAGWIVLKLVKKYKKNHPSSPIEGEKHKSSSTFHVKGKPHRPKKSPFYTHDPSLDWEKKFHESQSRWKLSQLDKENRSLFNRMVELEQRLKIRDAVDKANQAQVQPPMDTPHNPSRPGNFSAQNPYKDMPTDIRQVYRQLEKDNNHLREENKQLGAVIRGEVEDVEKFKYLVLKRYFEQMLSLGDARAHQIQDSIKGY